MVRVTLSYSTIEEKETLLAELQNLQNYKVIKVSKEYQGKGKGPHKKIYMDLSSK